MPGPSGPSLCSFSLILAPRGTARLEQTHIQAFMLCSIQLTVLDESPGTARGGAELCDPPDAGLLYCAPETQLESFRYLTMCDRATHQCEALAVHTWASYWPSFTGIWSVW